MTPVVLGSSQPVIGIVRSLTKTVTFIVYVCCCTSPAMLATGMRSSLAKLLLRSKHRSVSSLPSRSTTQLSLSREASYSDAFSTKVTIPPSAWKLDHSTPIHLVGSCFTDTISTALKKLKFNCYSNGQGIVFNPTSITECLSNVLESE
jgi:GSCFA family